MNKALLRQLCDLDGASGREDGVREFILEKLHGYTNPMDVTVDALGNILVHLHGKQAATHRVLFDAHMDEVGVMITHIRPDGMLGFDTVGGINKQVLFGHRVRFGKRHGVIGGKAVHQCSKDEVKKVPDIDSMYIDIGATDKDSAEQAVRVGQTGTFDTFWCEMEGDFFRGKAVDDRVGCAVLLELAATQPEYDINISFSVQEEIGLRGAKTVSAAVQPDVAVVLDATTAADVAGSTEETAVCRACHGAVVSFMDGSTLYDEGLYKQVRALAIENGIPTQTKNKIAGGNNAGAIQRSHTGVKMAAVSLPCRYIHSPACVGNWQDVEAMEQLVALLARELAV